MHACARFADLATVLSKPKAVPNRAALVELARRLHAAAAEDAQLERSLAATSKWKALCWQLF